MKTNILFVLILTSVFFTNCNMEEANTKLLLQNPLTERMAVMNIIKSLENLKRTYPELAFLNCQDYLDEKQLHPDSLNKYRSTTLFRITEDTTGYLYYENNVIRSQNPNFQTDCKDSPSKHCPPPYLEDYSDEYAVKLQINFISQQHVISRPLSRHFNIGEIIVEVQDYYGENRALLERIYSIIGREKWRFERRARS